MSEHWTDDAACRGSELDFFAINNEGKISRSLLDELTLLCFRCPVSRQCAAFAMRPGAVERYGVWAGSLPLRRLQMQTLPLEQAVEKILRDLREARSSILRRRLDNRSETFIKADIKHGLNGYLNLGCRCEVCAKAGTLYTRQRRRALAAV